MANFIVRNMYYVTGPGRSRIPRQPMGGSNPGLASINPDNNIAQNALPGTVFHSIPPAPSYMVDGQTRYYAFTSFSGGSENGVTTTDINAQLTETVAPSKADVIQLNVYVAHGGNGPGGASGAAIDAFDETQGIFVNDLFVNVTPDSGLTHDANYLGFVASAHAETVSAYSFISPTNASFDKWSIMPGTEGANDSVSMGNLNMGAGSNAVAFAFYKHESKTMKEFHKEHIKEIERKNLIPEIFKSPKENVELPGDFNDRVLPEVITQVQAIASKVAALDSKISELGKAFIKSQNRPEVGKEITDKTEKRK